MVLLIATRPGVVPASSAGARLAITGGASVDLPWWPDEIAASALAPTWTDTPRPGRAPHLTRDDDPLAHWRITCTVCGRDPEESVQGVIDGVDALGATTDTDAVAELRLAGRFAGHWLIVDAGWTATSWTSAGDVASADVIIDLRRPSVANVRIGPLRPRPKRKKVKR